MKKIFSLLIVSSILHFTVKAQELRGTVLSERGFAAAKVTVAFKDKSNQVVTNPDGSFRIVATKLPDTLLFSADGFEPYAVVITEKNLADPKFEVVLLEKRNALAMSKGSRKDAPDYYVDGVRVSDASIEKTEAAEYDTVIVFDPETYEEMITVTKKSDLVAAPPPPPPPPSGKTTDEVFMVSGRRERALAAHDRSSSAKMAFRSSSAAPGGSTSMVNGKTFVTTDTLSLPASISPKSRLLTAGEVNDFLKWEMWKDLSEAEFKSYSEYWGIVPKERFCLQLTNKSGDAIVGEPVSLLDKKTGKTHWRTVTDNTGKAELWAPIFPGETQQDFVIKGNGFEVKKPVSFHNGINQVEVKTACQTSSTVDIAFVVDATGSMADELEFLKLELEDVIRSTFDQHADLDLRVGSVFYRDLGEEYVTRHIDFNDDLLKVLNFIKLQSAKAGGDEPEAVDSALAVALRQLTWSQTARAKILFLISDAAPHGDAKERMKGLIEMAAAMGIRIVPLACSGTNKSYEYLQRSMALATNGTYACLTNHSGIGNKHEEPSTDSYKVELLNTLLQRLIEQMVFAPPCSENEQPLPLDQLPQAFQPGNPAGLKPFPNPTSGNMTVELNGEMEAVYLTDFTGKILERLAVEKTVHQLNLGGYPSGVYFIAYFTKDKKRGTERVVLQRG